MIPRWDWVTAIRFAWVTLWVQLFGGPWVGLLAPIGARSSGVFGLALEILWVLFLTTFDSALTGGEVGASLRRVSWSVLPFLLLGLGWNWIPLGSYPVQDFPLRKAEIAWGILWVGHLAWFTLLAVRTALGSKGRKVWAVFGAAGLLFFTGTSLQTLRCDLTGDEPHYLLMAHSLWVDGDLELSNNYRQNDARAFYARGTLEPQGNEHVLADGRRYSHHPLGPVLVFLPGFILAGRLGASLTLVAVTCGTLAGLLAWLGALGFKPLVVEQVGWIALFASPFLLYEGLLFPEMLTAGALVALGWALKEKKAYSAGLVLGILLWIHNRNVLLVIPALGLLGWAGTRATLSGREARRILGGLLTLALPLAWTFHELYGVWTPLGAHHEGMGSLFPFDRFGVNFPGLLTDQEAGLWSYFPILALVPAGWVLGWKRGSGLWRSASIVLLVYYGSMSFYENLGLQPAARFLAPLTPLLLAVLAPALEALEKSKKPWRVTAMGLFGISAGLNLSLAALPWMRYNPLKGSSWVLQLGQDLTGWPLPQGAPSFHALPIETRSYLLGWGALVAVALLTAWFVRDSRRRKAPR